MVVCRRAPASELSRPSSTGSGRSPQPPVKAPPEPACGSRLALRPNGPLRNIGAMTSFGHTADEALEALEAECARIERATSGLAEAAFGLPTRCPPWDVKALLAHLWRAVDRIPEYAAEPEPTSADADAVSYWRAYDPVGDAPTIATRSFELADRFATGAELAASFARHWRHCAGMARRMPPDRLLATRFTSIRLDEFLATRVVEASVHGLDLARALGTDPWLTSAGAAITGAILGCLFGRDAPFPGGWADVDAIELGTGRRALRPDERTALGDDAGRLPLLA